MATCWRVPDRLSHLLRVSCLVWVAIAIVGCSCDAETRAHAAARPAEEVGGSVGSGPAPPPPPHAPEKCANARDVTFIFTADTHFGPNAEIDQRNYAAIEQMNRIAGREWPAALGGRVKEPCGVLVGGDLTEDGRPDEWARFVRAFGLVGGDGALAYPVFETLGNHDKHGGPFVRERIAERHGSERYSWRWGDVHLVSLGEAPDDEDLEWLERDLSKLRMDTGVILYFHFPLDGPYSKGQWFGDGAYRDQLRRQLGERPVLGIFHGHYHATGMYRHKGIDVYRAGSPKHSWHTFTVVEVADRTMKVASWDYDTERWRWWHKKPVLGGEGATVWHRPDDIPKE